MKNNKPQKKSQIDLYKDALAIDAKNREAAALKDYNDAIAEIKKKHNVLLIHAGQYMGNQIKHFISFQSAPVTLQAPKE